MKRINMPNFTMSDVYDECYKSLTAGDKKNRINTYYNILISAEQKYDELMKRESIHFFRESLPDTVLVYKDMTSMYEDKMRGGNILCREYYDLLRNLTKLCPFCEIDSVSTLDHYLPKSKFPSLAITPKNLIGMCSECNSKKKEFFDVNGNEQILHPYYISDNLSSIYKVYFNVLNNTANIDLNNEPSFSDDIKKVSFHVKRLELIKRVNIEKASIIEDIRGILKGITISNNETISPEEKCKNYLPYHPCKSIIEVAIVDELIKNQNFLHSVMKENIYHPE